MTEPDVLALSLTTPPETEPGGERAGRLRRDLAIAAVGGVVVFQLASVFLEPPLPDAPSALLASLAAHPVRALLSSLAFVLALPAQIGVGLGVAHLVRTRSPRLGVVGALLLVLGSCGDSVNGGLNLAIATLAGGGSDPGLASVVGRLHQAHPVLVLDLIGLVGTVVGILLLSLAVFRGRVGPRWVGPALWAFLLVEFVGSSLVSQLSYVSVLLAAAAYLALAREMRRGW